ncbi:hypothetical protein [Bacillus halotolerans]|uniref:hypothetical protein n=1 Tax=Bacillus halotolerans TaxID=260554 RepID=UPI0020C242C1|nr:hypothetical protein [Bacillus halotolerans]UTL78867.1 hypothetical protein NLW79_11145 [Bacillus halotolerans]
MQQFKRYKDIRIFKAKQQIQNKWIKYSFYLVLKNPYKNKNAIKTSYGVYRTGGGAVSAEAGKVKLNN